MHVCSALGLGVQGHFQILWHGADYTCHFQVDRYRIVQFGGAVFRTVPLDFMTWMTIVVSTSFVFVDR